MPKPVGSTAKDRVPSISSSRREPLRAIEWTLAMLVGAGALTVIPAPVWAQAGEDPMPPEATFFQAVERGWFLAADVGMAGFVTEIDGQRYGPGPLLGIYAGYDILPIFNLGLGAMAWAGEVDLGDDPLPIDDAEAAPIGDLLYVMPTMRAQLAVFTTERNYVWVRADVGFGWALPNQIDGVDYGGNGPVVGVTAGFERFTKLRHFAIGIHGGVLIVTAPGLAVGVTVTPTLKYTF